jgi:hypothetical protein
MNSDIKNERFILVAENKSYRDVFFLIADAFGKKRPLIQVKPWQTNIFWRAATLLSKFTREKPLLDKFSAKSAHEISEYSSNKIKNYVPFEFEKIASVVSDTCTKFRD